MKDDTNLINNTQDIDFDGSPQSHDSLSFGIIHPPHYMNSNKLKNKIQRKIKKYYDRKHIPISREYILQGVVFE